MLWVLLSGVVFLVSAVIFIKVLYSPSNTERHLLEVCASYLSTMLSGFVFAGLFMAEFIY